MAAIKALPTPGLCYAPSDPAYFDADGLASELERVYDICHGCRLCFNLCPSFPALFDAVDREGGDVRKLTAADHDAVVDGCYQCKVCYVKCPYTPDDGHEFELDFPRLMLRANAQRARQRGVKLREKALGNPELLGRVASKVAPLANRANRSRAHRVLMEKVLGVHRDKQLPDFHRETFRAWFDARSAPAQAAGGREVVLFHTCFVNYNEPSIGRDAVAVLERNGVTVHCPEQTCCGMPALDGGDVAFAQRQARRNVELLTPFVERGLPVLAINPTCSYTLRKELVELVGPDYEERARAVSVATRDVLEYLFELKKAGELDRDFRSTPGDIAYHVPCHLKAQNIGFRSRDVMKTVPGAKVRLVDACCGHDGTWAMKTENFEASMKWGAKSFDGMREGGEMVTDCPLAAVQFEQATGTRPLHPLQLLARAYATEGFATAVADEEEAK